MAEDYAAKMSRKTEAELREYVSNRFQYREEAVLAALDELARRGTPEPAAAALANELQVSKQQTDQRESAARAQEAEKDQARRVARGEVAPEPAPETGPALYSPGTIALFSVLPMSMMIGGGILMGLNLLRLRRLRALALLVAFMLVYIVVVSNLVTWVILQAGLPPLLGFVLFNVPAMLVYIKWFWPRYVARDNYRSRSIFPPMLICFLILWGLQYAIPYFIKQQPKQVQEQVQQMEQMMRR